MADLSSIIKELITERDRFNAAIETLESVRNGASREGLSKKRTLSAAARRRIARAQRARWAKIRRATKK